jgi:hypothetical protein
VLRSIGAVIVGYLVFGVSAAAVFPLTGHDPHAPASPMFMFGMVVYGAVFAALGGYVAALIAGRRPRAHALAVGVLIALGSTVSLIASESDARWSQLAALVLMAPAAALAGMLRRRP